MLEEWVVRGVNASISAHLRNALVWVGSTLSLHPSSTSPTRLFVEGMYNFATVSNVESVDTSGGVVLEGRT